MTPPEIIPAETMQAEPVHPMEGAFPVVWAIGLAFVLGFLLALVGSHSL